ncbi:hypothetical protein HHK36_014442 [Tetracentron sinense]|uniref:Myb/SANT-like DNA-binding domain-containing protein n=1 Tax=Tetracentron sinense TaxID=13715 RepID=A0A834Z9Q8_TETSI|nr:hypothetical protein HHK36_014442 [Tetracentron sinense]
MEDEEEIQSQSQSQSHPSSIPDHPNGRITAMSEPVTVASAPPQQHTLTLALPIQQPRTAGGGREDCWSEGATSTLIDAWGERYLELSRGNLKQKHWKDVADIVGSRDHYSKPPKTDVQCKNRIDTLKKKYKLEKGKIASGSGPGPGPGPGPSKWSFFHRLDHLIGPTAKFPAGTSTTTPMPATPTPTLGHKVPVAIPVGGARSFHQFQHQQHQQQQKKKQQFRGPVSMKSESSKSEAEDSPDSTDSFPPETFNRKKPRIEREANSNPVQPGAFRRDVGMGRGRGWGNSVRELTQAIMKFGEAYERAESSKLQQGVEMEKQRMKFAKELELQRMQFFMKTQLELTQLKHGKKVGNVHYNNNNSNNSG